MPNFKWNDAAERMMLIKMLEQNLNTKLNVANALGSWPSELESPTTRGLGDRFTSLKKQIRESRVAPTLGAGATLTTSATSASSINLNRPGPVPSTPRALHSSRKIRSFRNPTTKSKEGARQEDDDDSGEDDPRLDARSSPNPISQAKGTSSIKFKEKLLGKTKPPVRAHGIKRKRQANDDDQELSQIPANVNKRRKKRAARNNDESSMSERVSDSESESNSESTSNKAAHKDNGKDSDTETAKKSSTAGSQGRRSLPRRSKSLTATPKQAPIDLSSDDTDDGPSPDGNSDGSARSQTLAVSDEEGHPQSRKARQPSQKRNKADKIKTSDSDNNDDSDDLFEMTEHRSQGKTAAKKAGYWREIVATKDGLSNDMEV